MLERTPESRPWSPVFLALAIGALAPVAPARAGVPVDEFEIALEELVADGVPEKGAGNIEEPGALDVYTLNVAAGTDVYFDELAGACGLRWECRAPDASVVFAGNVMCSADPGVFTLEQGGDYTITAFGNGDATGTYSFIVWEVNPDQAFTIALKDVVEDGVPEEGAGNIEEPGTRDVYTLAVDPGRSVFFDELAGACGLRWECRAPDDSLVFSDGAMCSGDPGTVALEQSGDYTITVFGGNGATGTYSFTVWEVNPVEVFTIGLEEIVEDGVPEEGAGNIEEAGTSDVYTLNVAAGTEVYFDELAGGCAIRWTCHAPDDSLVFSDGAMCSGDPGVFTLEQNGDYTITVFGSGDATGTYSFIVWEVNPDDAFAIGLKDVVEDGVPGEGAGNIEEPGTRDVYTLTLAPDTNVFFDELGGACGIRWECHAPDDSLVFSDGAICSTDPGVFTLEQGGDYTITVFGFGGATGTYSFTVWALNPPDEFTIGLNEVVEDGAPSAGAGNIEEPGAIDVYTLTLDPDSIVCFEELDGPCNLGWECRTPDDSLLFIDNVMCIENPGRFDLEQGGDYTITVFGQADATGTYSFVVKGGQPADLDGDCKVNFDDLLIVLAGWGGPDGDVNGDGTTDFDDLLLVLAQWT